MATAEELQALRDEINRLRVENEEFKKRQRPVTFEVNEKKQVAVHGIGKHPCSLYKNQWLRIIERVDDLKQFIEENAETLG